MDVVKAKVALVGARGVGKTSLVRRFVSNEFREAYVATLGAVVVKRTVDVPVNGRTVRVAMTVWDTMGDAAVLGQLRDVFLYGAQGLLAVADATEDGTVRSLHAWFDAAREVAGDVPVQVLMNKADLGAADDARSAGLDVAGARAAPCYATSARTGTNVALAFEDLARRIVERELVPPDAPLQDGDLRVAIACASPKTAEDVARLLGMPALLAEGRLERLRRRGYVRAHVGLDQDGRPRIAYEATQTAFLEPLAAARR